MKDRTTLLNVVCISIFAGFCALFLPHSAGASSAITIDPDQAQYVRLNATIMEVNLEKGYVDVAEKVFLIADYEIGGKKYHSTALDEEGAPISFDTLKKGQRVIVKAIQLPQKRILATIQKVAPKKTTGIDSP